MTEYRRSLPPRPEGVMKLPLDRRGYPIPWFVATLPDGRRDFRIADGRKKRLALMHRKCWVCGGKVEETLSFVIGPMCAVNRNTSEPGCHLDCALYAVTACPFMVRPDAQYRDAGIPADAKWSASGLTGNPGATCIWRTNHFSPYQPPGTDETLIRLGDPSEVLWFAEGKAASRAQILASFDARLPLLRDMAREQGAGAESALDFQVEQTMALLPA